MSIKITLLFYTMCCFVFGCVAAPKKYVIAVYDVAYIGQVEVPYPSLTDGKPKVITVVRDLWCAHLLVENLVHIDCCIKRYHEVFDFVFVTDNLTPCDIAFLPQSGFYHPIIVDTTDLTSQIVSRDVKMASLIVDKDGDLIDSAVIGTKVFDRIIEKFVR